MAEKRKNNVFFLFVLFFFKLISGRNLEEDFKLTILHVNDIHAHIEKTSEDLTR